MRWLYFILLIKRAVEEADDVSLLVRKKIVDNVVLASHIRLE